MLDAAPSTAWSPSTSGAVSEARAGTTLVMQGRRVVEVLLVESGLVSVTALVHGQSVFFGFMGAGRAFGLVPALLGIHHRASVVAEQDAMVRAIPIAEFRELRRVSEPFSRWLQETLAEEEEQRIRRLEAWSFGSCDARLDQVIVELAALSGREGPDGSVRLAFPVAIEKLSDLAGMRRETASRHFGRRIKAGTLIKQNGWFVVPRASDLMEGIREERILVNAHRRRHRSVVISDHGRCLPEPCRVLASHGI